MTGHEIEITEMLFVIFIQNLKFCGAIQNFGSVSKSTYDQFHSRDTFQTEIFGFGICCTSRTHVTITSFILNPENVDKAYLEIE